MAVLGMHAPPPAQVCEDSNEPTLLALAAAGLVDAWDARHSLPGPTWGPSPTWPALARIDYGFVSRHLRVLERWTVVMPGSDHCAVVLEFALPDGGPISR